MTEDKQVLVTEKTYEVDKKDFLHIQDVKPSWYNTTAGCCMVWFVCRQWT